MFLILIKEKNQMAIIKVDYGEVGGSGDLTLAISGALWSNSTGTGIKPFSNYDLADPSLVSYSSGKTIINQKGKYAIFISVDTTDSTPPSFYIGGVDNRHPKGIYLHTVDLNVGDEIYVYRNGTSTMTYSMIIALMS
jgi:hypothetical protein